jgi:hypothetical protein
MLYSLLCLLIRSMLHSALRHASYAVHLAMLCCLGLQAPRRRDMLCVPGSSCTAELLQFAGGRLGQRRLIKSRMPASSSDAL